MGRIIVFPPPGFDKERDERVTVLTQEDTNHNLHIFLFVSGVSSKEEEFLHKFEYPPRYEW